jgi:hypothetical protein
MHGLHMTNALALLVLCLPKRLQRIVISNFVLGGRTSQALNQSLNPQAVPKLLQVRSTPARCVILRVWPIDR